MLSVFNKIGRLIIPVFPSYVSCSKPVSMYHNVASGTSVVWALRSWTWLRSESVFVDFQEQGCTNSGLVPTICKKMVAYCSLYLLNVFFIKNLYHFYRCNDMCHIINFLNLFLMQRLVK